MLCADSGNMETKTIWSLLYEHDWTRDIKSILKLATCPVLWLLTGDLKEIGEKKDGLCSIASVWPETKKRTCEQPSQTERRQTQTQEVRRGLQDLQITPYCRQDDSWDH